jgi:Zn ribbon nucleic-acid-binding protein
MARYFKGKKFAHCPRCESGELTRWLIPGNESLECKTCHHKFYEFDIVWKTIKISKEDKEKMRRNK